MPQVRCQAKRILLKAGMPKVRLQYYELQYGRATGSGRRQGGGRVGQSGKVAGQIQKEKESALDLIDKERKSMQENIKNEIVDIAFLMAEKIVDHEIDKKANQELINQTLSKLEKED